jgi:predicted metalloprotease with PDZ domain
VSVTIVPSRPLAAPVVFVMPRAVPMGYDEQRYDSFVAGLAAGDPTAQALETTREDGPRWTVGRSGQQVARLSYTVDVVAMEQAVTSASDASRVRDGYVGLLGYSIFGYLENHETGSAAVTIDGPPDWPVLTTLDPRVPPVTGRAVANAGDFYALADSQVVMGPRAEFRRVPATVPLVVAVYAEGPVDVDRLGSLAAAAMDRVARYFGATPFRHYTIHQELLRPVSPRHQYGFSMEHLDSSTYYLAMDQGITASSGAADADRVLYNFAHHIAHAWIPKRSYGEGYYPFTWELAPVLDTIWFAEGFGQYAAIVAVAEGEPDPEAYRRSLLDRRFRSVLAAAPRFIRRMGLVELSRVASTRYSNDFRTGRNVFARGGLMAAEMDDRIRSATGGRKSLKDALRALVDWSARERRAFAIDDLPRIFETATGVATGDILARWLEPLE